MYLNVETSESNMIVSWEIIPLGDICNVKEPF